MIPNCSFLPLLLLWGLHLWAVCADKTKINYKKCHILVNQTLTALCDHYYPLAVHFNVLTPTQCGTLCGKYNYTKEDHVMTNEEVNSVLKIIDSVDQSTSFYSDDIPIFMHENSTRLWYFGESRYTTDDKIPLLFMTNNMNKGCMGFNYEEHTKICTISNKYPIPRKHSESTDLLFNNLIDPITKAELHANTYKIPLNRPPGFFCHYYQVKFLKFKLFLNYFF